MGGPEVFFCFPLSRWPPSQATIRNRGFSFGPDCAKKPVLGSLNYTRFSQNLDPVNAIIPSGRFHMQMYILLWGVDSQGNPAMSCRTAAARIVFPLNQTRKEITESLIRIAKFGFFLLGSFLGWLDAIAIFRWETCWGLASTGRRPCSLSFCFIFFHCLCFAAGTRMCKNH